MSKRIIVCSAECVPIKRDFVREACGTLFREVIISDHLVNCRDQMVYPRRMDIAGLARARAYEAGVSVKGAIGIGFASGFYKGYTAFGAEVSGYSDFVAVMGWDIPFQICYGSDSAENWQHFVRLLRHEKIIALSCSAEYRPYTALGKLVPLALLAYERSRHIYGFRERKGQYLQRIGRRFC